MALPFGFPQKPMLARRVDAVPTGGDFLFEPKWDGFRMLVFRDGDALFLQSRDEKPMERYFPELLEPLRRQLPERCAVDGEVVIAGPEGLDFDALLQRIHPAASRVARLAEETPASYVAFDLLCHGDESLLRTPFAERRARLEQALAGAETPLHLTPITQDPDVARDWFERFEGAGLDGVIAKPRGSAYEPGKRSMLKVKHQRTADCVLGGFRWHKNGEGTSVGSLLLGLYDGDGRLHHVGVAASFSAARRRELAEELAPLREDAAERHPWSDWIRASESHQRVPGGPSRWNRGKDLSWVPLRAERVVEVRYDHMQGTRFRHTAHFARWRPDKAPEECTYEQLEVTPPLELGQIFSSPT
ncbi:MAG: ATP-dependent DNA ligase [Myxococcota bacterium]|nr:ATP-dependent DNA ligase [Myxococcota bacterium]